MRKGGRRTHKQIGANSNVTDNAQMTQANSIGPCVKHFWPLDEGAAPATVTDIVGGIVIDPGAVGSEGITLATGAANTVRMYAFGAAAITGDWTVPDDKDVLIMCCAKAVGDSGDVDYPTSVGPIEFSMGGQLKIQPYYATFFGASAGTPEQSGIATPFYTAMKTRTEGENYVFAALKTGSKLKHYAQGIFTGENDISVIGISGKAEPFATYEDEMIATWNSWTPANGIRLGHSGYVDIQRCQPDGTKVFDGFGCNEDYLNLVLDSKGNREIIADFTDGENGSGIEDLAQDYYFLLVCVFQNGAPSSDSINEGMLWMKEDAINLPVGELRIFPGWVSLL